MQPSVTDYSRNFQCYLASMNVKKTLPVTLSVALLLALPVVNFTTPLMSTLGELVERPVALQADGGPVLERLPIQSPKGRLVDGDGHLALEGGGLGLADLRILELCDHDEGLGCAAGEKVPSSSTATCWITSLWQHPSARSSTRSEGSSSSPPLYQVALERGVETVHSRITRCFSRAVRSRRVRILTLLVGRILWPSLYHSPVTFSRDTSHMKTAFCSSWMERSSRACTTSKVPESAGEPCMI
ncbi:hypothetical protein EYF80_008853 [Liparis tanakae]|uniref:Uncharacterized protein n=1 Tax=Liparis tanakae TaxID=230148 RepID=A0A4Z2ITC8_9TELE|nr:hypothetical protein EYF80_008853 [Liparis tanakae]